jgi:hypothetical protein
LRGERGELGFFFGEEAEQHLTLRLVDFRGQEPAVVLDVEFCDSAIHHSPLAFF